MLIAGLTGNIASGKSSVASLLAARGVPIIDADALARQVVAPGSHALGMIVARWGAGVQNRDGSLDRAALRRIVFGDPDERAALNAIVHPEVGRRRDAMLRAARAEGVRIIVCDIPLLFEAGLARSVDLVLLVDAPDRVRLDRLTRDRHLDEAEAQAMLAAQMPAAEKRARADFVIDNAASLDELRARVDEVWKEVEARAAAPHA